MELVSLKGILLKKAEGNKNLQTMIEYMGEKQLFNSVVESLEKMAKMGTSANAPTTGFGRTMDITDKDQLRDAIGHHLGHYKAALKAHHAAPEGSPEKANYRKVADQHIGTALPLLHLAGKAAHHSKGELMMKYPSMMPWETNYTTLEPSKKNPGRYHRDAKGLSAYTVLAPGAKEDGYGIPNLHYFEMPPHPGHKKVANMSFTGAYPWEEIQLGHPEDVDAKKAHLHIPDVEAKDKFEEHPFDKHPISKYHKIGTDNLSEDMKQQYSKDLADFRSSPHHEKWLSDQEEQEKNDPKYNERGHTKSGHLYEGMPLKAQRAHIHNHPVVERAAPSDDSWEVEQDTSAKKQAAAPAEAAATSSAVGPKVRKKATAAGGSHPLDKVYEGWKTLSPEHQEAMLSAMPALKALVKERGGK